jgi:hypothetical protein
MAKSRIWKADGGWRVELPAFGFHRGTVKGGFGSHRAAVAWLTGNGILGSAGSSAERAATPEDRYCSANWPMVIR